MTLPRLSIPLLVLALLAPPGAAEDAVAPILVTLEKTQLDLGPAIDAALLFNVSITNPNPFAIWAGVDFHPTAERPGVVNVTVWPRSIPHEPLDAHQTRTFQMEMRVPVESIGDHVITLFARSFTHPGADATVLLPVRVHDPKDWPQESAGDGPRSLVLHHTPTHMYHYHDRRVYLELFVEARGLPSTLVVDILDPEEQLDSPKRFRVPLFPDQRFSTTLGPKLGFGSPDTVDVKLRLFLEETPDDVVELDVRLAPPPPPAPPEPIPEAPRHPTRFADDLIFQLPQGPLHVTPGGNVSFTILGSNAGDEAYGLDAAGLDLHRNVSGKVEWHMRAPRWTGDVAPPWVDVRPLETFALNGTVTAPPGAIAGQRVVVYVPFVVLRGVDVDTRYAVLDLVVDPPAPPPPPPSSQGGSPSGGTPPDALLGGAGDALRQVPAWMLGALFGFLLVASVSVVLLARREDWRWAALAGLAPLYTRLSRKGTLDHGTRKALLRIISATPGIHYRELKRRTEFNTGTLVHHLRTLEAQGYVTSRREGTLRRFYAAGEASPLPAAAPTTPVQERVLALVDEQPMTQRELAVRLELSQQGLNHHVKTLERKGLLVFQAGPDGVTRCHRVHRLPVER